MVEGRVHRVAYIETNRSEADVHKAFSACGEIHSIYPWKTGEHRASTHFFVEFENGASVKRARAFQTHDYKAHIVAYSPQMVAHFESVSRSSSPVKRSRFDRPASLSHLPYSRNARTESRPSSARKSSGCKTKSSGSQAHKSPIVELPPLQFPDVSSKNKENVAEAGPSYSVRPSSGSVEQTLSSTLYANTPAKEYLNTPHDVFGPKQPVAPTSSPALSIIKVEHEAERVSTTAQSAPPSQSLAPESALHRAREAPVTPPTIPSLSIAFSYCGQSLNYELDSLAKDPTDIIFVLSQAAAWPSERDKWMIIAGYYRSKRNIRAAISVVTAMVDVMMSPAIGLTNDDLRPAFIMLASCHTDLSRDSRRSGPEGAELAREHMEKAKKFFQVVYGTHFPSEESPRAASLASSRRLSLLQRVDRRPQDPMSPDDAVRIRTMEREIQSLRDKQTSYPGQLADARAAKRKVEEELDAERALRRKTEQETSAELLSARRSAKYALEQCKREVENRRRAEERTNELRDELATVQGELTGKLREAREKDRRARECFARLGSLFTKAAQGEVDDPTSPMFSSSSRSTRVTPVPPRPDSSSRPIRTTPSPSMGPPAKRVRTDNA